MVSLLPTRCSYVQGDPLALEIEQNWKTVENGGACSPGGHNVFVKDVDNDSVTEIMTGGFVWYGEYTRAHAEGTVSGQLRIWNWDGGNLTLEKSHEWHTTKLSVVLGVCASDLDDDGVIEIITTGFDSNGTSCYAQLKIWRWDGENLILEGEQEWCTVEDYAEADFWGNKGSTNVMSVYVGDVDDDCTSEIITGGRAYNGTHFNAQLRIWFWDGDTLVLEKSKEWSTSKEAIVNSIYIYDVDGDGVTEIMTGGFDHDLETSSGQLRIWSWNGETLILEKSQEWRTVEGTALNIVGNVMGNTMVTAVKTRDVDGDGFPEIVTGGFTYDGVRANGQLNIWNWDGENLKLENGHLWYTGNLTEVKSVSIEDVDSDKTQEIITSGFVWNGTHNLAQLRVWNWNGKTLVLENGQDWIAGEGACSWNVDTGDIDKDGITEIITVGCMYTGIKCDAHLRIWSVPREFIPPPFGLNIAIVTVTIATAVAAFYLYIRKNRKKEPKKHFLIMKD